MEAPDVGSPKPSENWELVQKIPSFGCWLATCKLTLVGIMQPHYRTLSNLHFTVVQGEGLFFWADSIALGAPWHGRIVKAGDDMFVCKYQPHMLLSSNGLVLDVICQFEQAAQLDRVAVEFPDLVKGAVSIHANATLLRYEGSACILDYNGEELRLEDFNANHGLAENLEPGTVISLHLGYKPEE